MRPTHPSWLSQFNAQITVNQRIQHIQQTYMYDVDSFGEKKICAMSKNKPQPLITSGIKVRKKMD